MEAIAEGEASAVERFERAMRRGPSRSRVEHVMVDEIEPGPTGKHRFVLPYSR